LASSTAGAGGRTARRIANGEVLGAPWQRCTVHFLRDLCGYARKDQQDALGAIIRALFTALDGDEARRALFRVVHAAYEKRGIALTGNIHPAGFDELTPKTLATATVDRLLHHARVDHQRRRARSREPRGELVALRWRDVDFARSHIRVRVSYSKGGMTRTKSGKIRAVPMAPAVAPRSPSSSGASTSPPPTTSPSRAPPAATSTPRRCTAATSRRAPGCATCASTTCAPASAPA
jgi:Transposase, Mutator family/IstB-like ATP binding protein